MDKYSRWLRTDQQVLPPLSDVSDGSEESGNNDLLEWQRRRSLRLGLTRLANFSSTEYNSNTDTDVRSYTSSLNMSSQSSTILGSVDKYMNSPFSFSAFDSSRYEGAGENGQLTINLSGCKYEAVRLAAAQRNFAPIYDEVEECDVTWVDSAVPLERVAEMQAFQRINHFPAMNELSRKDRLARNLARMRKRFPEQYNFSPRTWILPSESIVFSQYWRQNKKKEYFIIKPSNGSMGRGIHLLRHVNDLSDLEESVVVQEYLKNPFLIDGYKFDLRMYVLITSCDPLRIYLYKEGLARFSTCPYRAPSVDNIDCLYMHLTNYSINKNSSSFNHEDDISKGSKRSLSSVFTWMRQNGIDDVKVKADIANIIVKTLFCGQPYLTHAYHMARPHPHEHNMGSLCFEVLGFDIILDDTLKPWVLEVNHAPSFGTDALVDRQVKLPLIMDTLHLLNVNTIKRKTFLDRKRSTQHGRLLPKSSSTRKAANTTNSSNEGVNGTNLPPTNTAASDSISVPTGWETSVSYPTESVVNSNDTKDSSTPLTTQKQRLYNEYINSERFRSENELARLSQTNNFTCIYPVDNGTQASEFLSFLSASQHMFSGRNIDYMVLEAALQFDGIDKSGDVEGSTAQRISSRAMAAIFRMARDSGTFSSIYGSASGMNNNNCSILRSSIPSSHKLGEMPVRQYNGARRGLQELSRAGEEDEDWLRERTVRALRCMRIKFPGKSDIEADRMLDLLRRNWKPMKSKVGYYWLVKLDDIKRKKIIEIVHSNIRSIVKREWKRDLGEVGLLKILGRLFNFLLWNNGQGLWSSFSGCGSRQSGWEANFSLDNVSRLEMECCRRAVQLCKDCLLIVYLYAVVEKQQNNATSDISRGNDGSDRNNFGGAKLLTSETRVLSGRSSDRLPSMPSSLKRSNSATSNKRHQHIAGRQGKDASTSKPHNRVRYQLGLHDLTGHKGKSKWRSVT